MLAVHCYDPYDYTLGDKQYEQWGHSGADGKKDPNGDEKERHQGMGCLLWDNGATGVGREKHGYINHGTGADEGDSKEVIDVMVNAMTNEDPDYTLKYIYTKAPRP